MTVDRVVATIPKRDGLEIRATLNAFKGSWFAHLREYFLSDVSGEWHPTQRGITVRADAFEELEAAVRSLRQAIDELPKKRPDRYERYRRMRSTA